MSNWNSSLIFRASQELGSHTLAALLFASHANLVDILHLQLMDSFAQSFHCPDISNALQQKLSLHHWLPLLFFVQSNQATWCQASASSYYPFNSVVSIAAVAPPSPLLPLNLFRENQSLSRSAKLQLLSSLTTANWKKKTDSIPV